MRAALRVLLALAALVAVAAAAFAANVWMGMRATARVDGTIAGLGVTAPVQILRDDRGIPHIRAANERDLFFAQGYVEGQDRLFQLDLLRRFVYGRLSEVLGSVTLAADERARIVPVAEIVARQWQRLTPHQQMILTAFADGVNAAAARESPPVEFRALAYRMEPWRPQDALTVGFATVLDLTDTWNDVAARAGRATPLSDACFDAPVTAGLGKLHTERACQTAKALSLLVRTLQDPRPPIGSNEWAAGALHATTHRALLANDPHLDLQIPGVWYLIDLRAPGYHAAGATLAGTPGVILGHNDRIAWGATNGTVTSLSVYDSSAAHSGMHAAIERFGVRFSSGVAKTYYRDDREFEAPVNVMGVQRTVVVRWPAYADPVSPLPTFDALDRSTSIEGALAALARYPGPTQNFEIADVSGRVAYQLAGDIPDDPAWGRAIHPNAALREAYANVPFAMLPRVAPSRSAVVWTSNNKMYGRGYPLRLSPQFAPPCRAYRVATLLEARPRYDLAYFRTMQLDVYSPCERALTARIASMRAWDGEVTGRSVLATQAVNVRIAAVRAAGGMIGALASPLPSPLPPSSALLPWSQAGAVRVLHPLGALGLGFLDGTTLPGNGDSYTVHVQAQGFSQSFRAIWDVGNWDGGGITIPQGESGRPGSGHYTDESAAWVAGRLLPLPFTDAALRAVVTDRLTLAP